MHFVDIMMSEVKRVLYYSLGVNLMFSLREKISTTQAPMF